MQTCLKLNILHQPADQLIKVGITAVGRTPLQRCTLSDWCWATLRTRCQTIWSLCSLSTSTTDPLRTPFHTLHTTLARLDNSYARLVFVDYSLTFNTHANQADPQNVDQKLSATMCTWILDFLTNSVCGLVETPPSPWSSALVLHRAVVWATVFYIHTAQPDRDTF